MNPITGMFIVLAFLSLLGYLIRRKRDANPALQAKDKEARQNYEEMMAAGETLLAVAPSPFCYALTDRRLIVPEKGGYTDVPISEIRKVVYRNASLFKVKSPRDVMVAGIKTKKKTYSVSAVSEDSFRFFEELWKMFPG